MENEPHVPRRLSSSTRSRFTAVWPLAAGVFIALCLMMSPVNLPAHSAIAAVPTDDLPGEYDRTAQEGVTLRQRARRRTTRRLSLAVRAAFHRVAAPLPSWSEQPVVWAPFSGVPPPPRRGPPHLT